MAATTINFDLAKTARSQQLVGQALPQTNDAKQSYLTVIGLLLLSTLGLGAYSKKRRV
ncbi:LPXTG cell wall anchor domain-containing protein [Loigolactobacillus binensis]|uniref:LPXTG cell wall anchor domain-containing protein n=1 Tax=Loigolactobacillus binensis TaxID=2559922 RepID=A0ABW3EIL9_9LACO|nr:LPXTG cell wall anchor domain-containing protein [Loigolactobacillus binensis]